MDRQALIRAVKGVILRHAKPERIYLYGSQANGEATATSDVDIAFDDADFRDWGALEEALDALPALVKVDVKNLHGCEERFVNRVRSTGKVLYSANKALRFEDGLHNFSRALERFAATAEGRARYIEDGYDDVYLDILVKRFEFTYETAWKAIKRHLDFHGLDCTSPRSCFREAYAQRLIDDQSLWLDMIETRNLSSHVYSEEEVSGLLDKALDYLAAFRGLHGRLTEAVEGR